MTMSNCILYGEIAINMTELSHSIIASFLWSKMFWLSSWKYSSLSVHNKFVTYQEAIHCLGNLIFPLLCYSMCLIINSKRKNSVKEKRNHKSSLFLLNYIPISVMVSTKWPKKEKKKNLNTFFPLKVEV